VRLEPIVGAFQAQREWGGLLLSVRPEVFHETLERHDPDRLTEKAVALGLDGDPTRKRHRAEEAVRAARRGLDVDPPYRRPPEDPRGLVDVDEDAPRHDRHPRASRDRSGRNGACATEREGGEDRRDGAADERVPRVEAAHRERDPSTEAERSRRHANLRRRDGLQPDVPKVGRRREDIADGSHSLQA
jgi:hypothetical protein